MVPRSDGKCKGQDSHDDNVRVFLVDEEEVLHDTCASLDDFETCERQLGFIRVRAPCISSRERKRSKEML